MKFNTVIVSKETKRERREENNIVGKKGGRKPKKSYSTLPGSKVSAVLPLIMLWKIVKWNFTAKKYIYIFAGVA